MAVPPPKPITLHTERSVARALYHTFAALSVLVLIIFGYLTYLAYITTVNTPYFILSYVIVSPVFVAGFLLIMLVTLGQRGFYRELEQLKKYKVKF